MRCSNAFGRSRQRHRDTAARSSRGQRRVRPSVWVFISAELKGPPQLERIRPEIFDFEPDLDLKLSQTQPQISGTVPTNRHTTIPNDSGPLSACFDGDPTLLNCEIAQPRDWAEGKVGASPCLSCTPRGFLLGGDPYRSCA